MHAWPYHGQSKPIERFHNTLADRFCRQWDTYCGRDTLHKPENLQEQIARGKAPTLQELTDAFTAWLATDYHARVHAGDAMDGRTPDQAFAQELRTKRTTTTEILQFACLPRVGPLKIGQDGIAYKGLWFGGFNQQIQRLFGQQVLLAIDNRNLSSVMVLDLQGRLICTATANRKMAFDPTSQDLRDAISDKKQLRKRLREYNDSRPRIVMASDTHSLLERAAVRRMAAQVLPELPPCPSTPVQTGLEDQIREIEAAINKQPMRLAVGYDSAVALPDLSESFSNMRIGDDPAPARADMFDRFSFAMDGASRPEANRE